MADYTATGDPVEAIQPDELGLAGAEQRLINLNLNAGQLSVQRQILQLRVDYLTQLNTQTMLLAGSGIYMLSSLELEAIMGANHENEHHTFGQHVRLFLYVMGSSLSVGCSIWVLYTSNNLINLATLSALYAARLQDVHMADNILGLRMRDVRRMWILALLTMLPALLIMVFHLVYP